MNKNKVSNIGPSGRGSNKRNNNDRNIRFRCGFTNTIMDVLKARGWTHVTEEGAEWDFYWCDVGWMREVGFISEYLHVNPTNSSHGL